MLAMEAGQNLYIGVYKDAGTIAQGAIVNVWARAVDTVGSLSTATLVSLT